jgi:hypothetical protein
MTDVPESEYMLNHLRLLSRRIMEGELKKKLAIEQAPEQRDTRPCGTYSETPVAETTTIYDGTPVGTPGPVGPSAFYKGLNRKQRRIVEARARKSK